MTVKELRQHLNNYKETQEVLFRTSEGDYHGLFGSYEEDFTLKGDKCDCCGQVKKVENLRVILTN